MSNRGNRQPGEVPDYLAENVRAALATDPRVAGLDVEVVVTALGVEPRGCVATEARRRAAVEVVGLLLPGRAIVDRLVIADYPEPAEPEVLA